MGYNLYTEDCKDDWSKYRAVYGTFCGPSVRDKEKANFHLDLLTRYANHLGIYGSVAKIQVGKKSTWEDITE